MLFFEASYVTNLNLSKIFYVLVKEILDKNLGIPNPKRKKNNIKYAKIKKGFNNSLYKFISK